MKFKKYYFDNIPANTPFDFNNPRYVLALEGVDAILEKVINSKPYSLTRADFSDLNLVNALLDIDVLCLKNDRIGMAVPFFTDMDSDVLCALSRNAANRIAQELLSHRQQIVRIVDQIDNGYSVERNLFHILGAYLFDGLLFDYLEEKQLVTTSCIHRSGLDYLVLLYEDAASLNEYSDRLLCSYNRLVKNGKGFVSFGDSNGSRKDFYRFMRQGQLNFPTAHGFAASAETLIENYERLLDGYAVDSAYLEIYEEFGYCKSGESIVPVYDSHAYKIANELYCYVIGIIEMPLLDALKAIQSEKRLLSVAHEVSVQDIANEVYHLIFGEVNELLVESQLMAEPPYSPGEGRYYKSFER